MSRPRLRWSRLAMLVPIVVAACSDQGPVLDVQEDFRGPELTLIPPPQVGEDRELFYFMPPIVVGGPQVIGLLDPSIPVEITICPVTLAGECVADDQDREVIVGYFDDGAVERTDDGYGVVWVPPVASGGMYNRIKVYGDGVLFGFADVWVRASETDPGPGDAEEFTVGEDVDVRFRIDSQYCDPTRPEVVECNEGTITNAGGTVAVSEEGAPLGVTFSAFSLPAGTDEITVLVERLQLLGEECITGLDLPQFGPCFRITTVPELEDPLQIPALVSMCLDLGVGELGDLSEAQEHQLQIHRFTEAGELQALPNATSDLCDTLLQGAWLDSERSIFGRFASLLGHAVRTLGPEPLRAADLGFGGLTVSFSRFRWALPAKMEVLAGDDQVGVPGQALPVEPAVLVTDALDAPVADARVHFDVTLGDGSVAPVTVMTGADGVARTDWTLGPLDGSNVLRAYGLGISDGAEPYAEHYGLEDVFTGDVEFSAEACPAGAGTATLDGVIGDDEWGCAAVSGTDFDIELGPETASASLRWMNDGENLYFALELAGTVTALDRADDLIIRIDFDNDADGASAAGDDAIEFSAKKALGDLYLRTNCLQLGHSNCGTPDTRAGVGTVDGSGAFLVQNDGTVAVYEFAHPLNSGDIRDIAVGSGDDLGFFLSARRPSGGIAYWPAFLGFQSVVIR